MRIFVTSSTLHVRVSCIYRWAIPLGTCAWRRRGIVRRTSSKCLITWVGLLDLGIKNCIFQDSVFSGVERYRRVPRQNPCTHKHRRTATCFEGTRGRVARDAGRNDATLSCSRTYSNSPRDMRAVNKAAPTTFTVLIVAPQTRWRTPHFRASHVT